MCIPVRLFFFSLALILTLEAANMCHFLIAAIKFPVFLPTKFVTVLFYLSLFALSSVKHLSVDIRV